jgi:hypothetical protein
MTAISTPVFQISQLKKHIGPNVIPQANLPLTNPDGNIKMFPERLLERRMIPHNNEPVIQWLIHWVNLPESTATWEDADFIHRVFADFTP